MPLLYIFDDTDSGGTVFDNWRILHGRTAFRGKRRMCGGYSMFFYFLSWECANALSIVNNDDFVSRYRLLNDGREKTLNSIGTFDARLSC